MSVCSPACSHFSSLYIIGIKGMALKIIRARWWVHILYFLSHLKCRNPRSRRLRLVLLTLHAHILAYTHMHWSPMRINGPLNTLIWSFNMAENDKDYHYNAPSVSFRAAESPLCPAISFIYTERSLTYSVDHYARSISRVYVEIWCY